MIFYLHRCDEAVLAFTWKLKEPNEIVAFIALNIIDCCMKNCELLFPRAVRKCLMDEIVYIAIAATKGADAEVLAQILIQEWGMKYKGDVTMPLFSDVYANLKSKGISFPSSNKRPSLSRSMLTTPGTVSSSSMNASKQHAAKFEWSSTSVKTEQ